MIYLATGHRAIARYGVAPDQKRGWLAARSCRSMPARHTLLIVSTAAATMPGSGFEAVEFAERERWQCRLNGQAQGLIIDRARETPRESSRKLLQGENVQSVLALTRGRQAPLAHGMTAMDDHSMTTQALPPPLQRPTSTVSLAEISEPRWVGCICSFLQLLLSPGQS